MTRYTRAGKQILVDGKHMADAVDDTAAMMILNALRGMEERSDAVAFLTPLKPDYIDGDSASITIRQHVHMRQGDEFSCSCGLRWGVDEADPH